MAKMTIREKADLLDSIVEDMVPDIIGQARKDLANELTKDAKRAKRIGGFAFLEYDEVDLEQVGDEFLAGFRFAARLVADTSYEY